MRPIHAIASGTALLVLATLAGCGASGPTGPAVTGTPAGATAPPASDGGSPRGSIVYLGPVEGGAGIRIVGTDGTGDHWLFPDVRIPKDGYQAHADWSLDGKRLAFASDDPADPPAGEITRDLWVGDADGANARRIFDCVAPCSEAEDPAWSPDGRLLAFATWGEAQPASLAVLDLATGSISLILTVDHDPDAFRRPQWSPDGRRIVLEHQTWTGGEDDQIVDSVIGIVDLDAASPRFTPITEPAMWATYPDWHPTENRIVFSTRPWSELDDGPSNLYAIRPDGSEMTALTDFAKGQSRTVQPRWTPNGKQIIFTKIEGTGFGSPTMAMIDADGTGLWSATGDAWLFGTHPRLRPTP